MKVVVTSQGTKLNSETDPRFGRAKCFILVDTVTGTHQVVDNTQNLNAAQGAGIQAAQTVARLKAEAVLTGHCGPKAFDTLDAVGIKVVNDVMGTIRNVVKEFDYDKAVFADKADTEAYS